MNSEIEAREITFEILRPEEGVGFLIDLFGPNNMSRGEKLVVGELANNFENFIYYGVSVLDRIYVNLASWHLYRLSNGGGYMAPINSTILNIDNHDFGSSCLSSDAAGLFATLCALRQLEIESEESQKSSFIDQQNKLCDFISQHIEGKFILELFNQKDF